MKGHDDTDRSLSIIYIKKISASVIILVQCFRLAAHNNVNRLQIRERTRYFNTVAQMTLSAVIRRGGTVDIFSEVALCALCCARALFASLRLHDITVCARVDTSLSRVAGLIPRRPPLYLILTNPSERSFPPLMKGAFDL